jgi:hypothetical protein
MIEARRRFVGNLVAVDDDVLPTGCCGQVHVEVQSLTRVGRIGNEQLQTDRIQLDQKRGAFTQGPALYEQVALIVGASPELTGLPQSPDAAIAGSVAANKSTADSTATANERCDSNVNRELHEARTSART